MAERMYLVCFDCHIISCNSRNCESPKPDCQESCMECLDEVNVHFDFCVHCRKDRMVEFEKQFRGAKPRLRLETKRDEEDGA